MSDLPTEWNFRVVDVEGGTGVPAIERAWTLCYLKPWLMPLEDMLHDAARVWYDETDQCGEPQVRLEATSERDSRVLSGVVVLEIRTVPRTLAVDLQPKAVRS